MSPWLTSRVVWKPGASMLFRACAENWTRPWMSIWLASASKVAVVGITATPGFPMPRW